MSFIMCHWASCQKDPIPEKGYCPDHDRLNEEQRAVHRHQTKEVSEDREVKQGSGR